MEFLSIQAQDFIEDQRILVKQGTVTVFLSIQAQDFIEDLMMISILKKKLNS